MSFETEFNLVFIFFRHSVTTVQCLVAFEVSTQCTQSGSEGKITMKTPVVDHGIR